MNSSLTCAALLLVLGSAFVACEPPYLDPADYDRTCAQDSNCALVGLTDVCNCTEPPTAVNVRAVAQAEEDASDAVGGCGDVLCPPVPRPWGDAVCREGQCAFLYDTNFYSRPRPE